MLFYNTREPRMAVLPIRRVVNVDPEDRSGPLFGFAWDDDLYYSLPPPEAGGWRLKLASHGWATFDRLSIEPAPPVGALLVDVDWVRKTWFSPNC